MFKNLSLYRFQPDWAPADGMELFLPQFTPCRPTEPRAIGFAAPRGRGHTGLIEPADGGGLLLRVVFERRQLPADVVKERVEQMAQSVERHTGRKPGRKQLAQLKDEATQALLPQAFQRQTSVMVWLDTSSGRLCLDTSNATLADAVLTLLANNLDGLTIKPFITNAVTSQAMAEWLVGDAPPHFTVDRDCQLESTDEMKSVVRYARHPLDIDQVQDHILQGKRPIRLALTWADRISFILTATRQIKSLKFLDVVFEDANPDTAEEEFDATAAIVTGELGRMLPDLIDALGGEVL